MTLQMCWAAKCVQLLRSRVFQEVKCSLMQSVPQPSIIDFTNKLLNCFVLEDSAVSTKENN